MSYNRNFFAIAALATLAAAGRASAQVSSTSTDAATAAVPAVAKMTLTNSTQFASPSSNDYDKGYVDNASGASLAVSSNTTYAVSVKGSPWSFTPANGSPSTSNKLISDFLINGGSLTALTPLSSNGVTVISGGKPGVNSAVQFAYRMNLSYASDAPGTYGMTLSYTLTAP